MNSRRSFFTTLTAVVAAVAIAPEIAFRRKLELPAVTGWDVGAADASVTYIAYRTDKDGNWSKAYIRGDDIEKPPPEAMIKINVPQFEGALSVILLQSPTLPSACSPSSDSRS